MLCYLFQVMARFINRVRCKSYHALFGMPVLGLCRWCHVPAFPVFATLPALPSPWARLARSWPVLSPPASFPPD